MKKRLLLPLVLIVALTAGAALLSACGSSSTTATGSSGGGTATTQSVAGGPPDMSAVFADTLAGLVSDGTLTAAQQEAVLNALSTAGPAGAPGAGQPSAAPAPQGSPPAQADGQMNPPDASSMVAGALEPLVAEGTLTSAQQQAVVDALSSAMPQPGSAPAAAPGGATQSS